MFLVAKVFAASVSDYNEFLVYWRKERVTCNVILIEHLALHITLTNVMEERLPTDTWSYRVRMSVE